MRKYLFFLTFLITLFLTHTSYPQNELTAEQIYESVNNSVVVILATNKDETYQGSGVVLNNEGYVVTNLHVIKDASKIEIKHYNKTYTDIDSIYSNEDKDILILRIRNNDLKPINFGTSDNLKRGQKIFTVGSPEGFENTISDGIISGFRTVENDVNLIQMTAPITDGSSGGAVVNGKGELIGLSVSGQHEGNIYFAIPVNDLIELLNKNNIAYYRNIETNIITSENRTSIENINYFLEASLAYDKEDYKNAIVFFSKHIEQNTNDALAYFKRGYSYSKLNEYKQAITDFTLAIKNNPDNFEPYFYRGNAHYSLFNFDKGLVDYTKAIELAPNAAILYYNRGLTFYKSKKYSEAISDWQKAISLEPQYEDELSEKIQQSQKLIIKK